eukprot:6432870-Amphidinium_carterae.1
MELRTYYDRSIRSQRENPREHEELQELFRLIDRPYGPPDEYEIPNLDYSCLEIMGPLQEY